MEGGVFTKVETEPGILFRRATLAQLVEQCFRKAEVPGSIPGGGSTHTDRAERAQLGRANE